MKRKAVYADYIAAKTRSSDKSEYGRVLGINKKTGKAWVKFNGFWGGQTRLIDLENLEFVKD